MIIYLSGPITGSSDFAAVFDRVRQELEEGGVSVINPAGLNGVASDGVLGYEDYMTIDKMLLSKAEALDLMIFEYDENGGHFGPFKGWRSE